MRSNHLLFRALAISVVLHLGLVAQWADLRMPTFPDERKSLAVRLNGGRVEPDLAATRSSMTQGDAAQVRRGPPRRSTSATGRESTTSVPIAVLPERDAVEIRLLVAAALTGGDFFSMAHLPSHLEIVWQVGGDVTIQGVKLPSEIRLRLIAGITGTLSRSRALERGGRLSLDLLDLDTPVES